MLSMMDLQAMALVKGEDIGNDDDQAEYYMSILAVEGKTMLSTEGAGKAIKRTALWLDVQTSSA